MLRRSTPDDRMDWLHAFLGIKASHLIAGIAGGIVRAFLTGSDLMTAVASVVVGSLTAGYLTSPIFTATAPYLPLPPDASTEHAVSFLVGLTAMLLCEGVLRATKTWSKNPKMPGGK
jgi:uncharacterized membrane protein